MYSSKGYYSSVPSGWQWRKKRMEDDADAFRGSSTVVVDVANRRPSLDSTMKIEIVVAVVQLVDWPN